MNAPRIPLNFFGMPFGLAGLAGTWLTMGEHGSVPVAVGNTLLGLAAVVWTVLVLAYLRHLSTERGAIKRDLFDPVAAPFASLILITPMLLAAEGVFPHAEQTGRVLFDVFAALSFVLGGWFTGQWIYGGLDLDKFHPGYFLPTIAGGLVAAIGASQVGQRTLAEAFLGQGVLCWIILGSLILGRLLFRPRLPDPLVPTLAIEVAPAAVASLAYFSLHGDHIDATAAALGGYGLLMVLAQLRLLPAYLTLPFMPSTWAFTFSWAAVATATIHWLYATTPSGHQTLAYVVLAAITILIGGVAIRTLIALQRHQYLPATPPR